MTDFHAFRRSGGARRVDAIGGWGRDGAAGRHRRRPLHGTQIDLEGRESHVEESLIGTGPAETQRRAGAPHDLLGPGLRRGRVSGHVDRARLEQRQQADDGLVLAVETDQNASPGDVQAPETLSQRRCGTRQRAIRNLRVVFLERDGVLTDNSRIGPDLAEHYWAPGNAVPFDHTVQSLTGRSLSADSLATACNRTVDEAIAEARASIKHAQTHPRPKRAANLDATIHVVHGRERVASTDNGGIDGLCEAFETWVGKIELGARSS